MNRRWIIVLGSVGIAVVVNLVIFFAGRAAGGTFDFVTPVFDSTVGPLDVALFSAIPLGIGLTIVALLARYRWITLTAAIVAPLIAWGSIGATLTSQFDQTSVVTLALCHVVVGIVALVGVLALRRDAAAATSARPEAPATI